MNSNLAFLGYSLRISIKIEEYTSNFMGISYFDKEYGLNMIT